MQSTVHGQGQESIYSTTTYILEKYQKSTIDALITYTCGPSIQTVTLNYPKNCVKKYLIKFLSNFSSICEKIQTP